MRSEARSRVSEDQEAALEKVRDFNHKMFSAAQEPSHLHPGDRSTTVSFDSHQHI